MTPLMRIKSAGFTLSLTGSGGIYIEPSSKLTDIQRNYLRDHKAEIVAELQALAANDESKTNTIPPMESWQVRAISAWVRSLGGSEAEIAEETAETLHQCETDAEARLYYLKRAAGQQIDSQLPDIVQSDAYPRSVIVWTPAGNPVTVTAKSEEHEKWLLRANPAPKHVSQSRQVANTPKSDPLDTRVRCRQCRHHRPAPGRAEFVVQCLRRKTIEQDDLARNCGDHQAITKS